MTHWYWYQNIAPSTTITHSTATIKKTPPTKNYRILTHLPFRYLRHSKGPDNLKIHKIPGLVCGQAFARQNHQSLHPPAPPSFSIQPLWQWKIGHAHSSGFCACDLSRLMISCHLETVARSTSRIMRCISPVHPGKWCLLDCRNYGIHGQITMRFASTWLGKGILVNSKHISPKSGSIYI